MAAGRSRFIPKPKCYDEHQVPLMMDVATAAWVMGAKEAWVTQELREGRLHGTKVGKGWRIHKYDLYQFLGVEESLKMREFRQMVQDIGKVGVMAILEGKR